MSLPSDFMTFIKFNAQQDEGSVLGEYSRCHAENEIQNEMTTRPGMPESH
jgi:hypothetical protein